MSSAAKLHDVYRHYLDAVVLHGQATAQALGMHATDLYALSVLQYAGRLTSGEIAERTGLTTGAATRLIDRLESRGLVRRVVDPADRRKVVVEPADVTALEIDEVVGPARRRLGEIFAGFDAKQLDVLSAYFLQATAAYQAATEEVRQQPR
ncbi:DNA-binding MarR family transcriptional regulator [Hamadaea flava]|uniref:MarR family winged helix-turn-helix transcriptional regulator n=1 Tax=Hamadaea flava TaxID=1742688 RepID=A0ABV8LKI2_9ACTN|nr:MarR family transcriptional regulator [Hamadaea flava]MCP2323949.1 DNA-binding MarR family transcriptional regulator [Hamadaea flava]